MELEKITQTLRKKLTKSGWNEYLWQYWVSKEWEHVLSILVEEVNKGRRWVPGIEHMFRFLKECPVNSIKVIMLLDRIGNTIDYNDGIPLSSKNRQMPTKKTIEILETIPGYSDSYSLRDMAVWAKQGVLMIPTAMTAEVDRYPHYKLWSPFICYLIGKLNKSHKDVPYVLYGTEAIDYIPLIQGNKIVVQTTEEWKPVWDNINTILVGQGKEPIVWLK